MLFWGLMSPVFPRCFLPSTLTRTLFLHPYALLHIFRRRFSSTVWMCYTLFNCICQLKLHLDSLTLSLSFLWVQQRRLICQPTDVNVVPPFHVKAHSSRTASASLAFSNEGSVLRFSKLPSGLFCCLLKFTRWVLRPHVIPALVVRFLKQLCKLYWTPSVDFLVYVGLLALLPTP